MNREQRRRYFKKYRKHYHLGFWKEWNDQQPKQKPYINYDKHR